MAAADHTSPVCPSDRNDPRLEVLRPPAPTLPPLRSSDAELRQAGIDQDDPYFLAVLAIERVLSADRDYVPPLLPPGVRLCGQLLPLTAPQRYGLHTALNVLHQHVDPTRRPRGD
ncbi:hypothetical protein [Dyella acidiphila]|uniref:Uncharacterized protein n=1 Tax=Dyella acidiphila TaxID=2775866 RepID=A0ABR9GCJ9_9GAMM|nr:hypothetical protein [Dyella acidiphila]MBE1161766.1 hypothetical protein [Dyella acidiphila]